MSDGAFGFGFGSAVSVFGVGLLCAGLWGCPQYGVYEKRLAGDAEYQQAEYTRKVKVLEAQATLDSAALTAKAEVERAKGVAEANRIIADSLGGPEGYLRWRYIEMLEGKSGGETIYIPTEAGLPVLEAGRVGRNN